jgi:rhodanese-related sulfurtransferase
MKKLLNIFCFLVLIAAFVSCNSTLKGEAKVVSPEEMKILLKLDDVQLVDIRTPKEFKEGFIANAQNINFFSPSFDEDIKKLDKQKPVILYCRSGRRSAKCTKKLLEAGFMKIYDLDGGIEEWKHDGFSTNVK